MGSILLRIREALNHLIGYLKPTVTREAFLLRTIRLNHTYPFLSGIGISLATNTFVSLAIEGGVIKHVVLFLSGLLMLISGSLYMWLLWRTHAYGKGLPEEDRGALSYLTTMRTNSPDEYSRMAQQLLGSHAFAIIAFTLGLIAFIPCLW